MQSMASSVQQRQSQKGSRPSTWVVLSAMLCMGCEWVLLVAGTRLHEMIVGGFAVLLAGLFLSAVMRSEAQKFQFRAADLIAAWRIPWYILTGVYEITVVLFKDLATLEQAGSFYRFCGFKTGKRDPVLIARRVLATAYTTAAPNFIVIGIDYEQSRMLFHQLERSTVPKMTRTLGAQS